jgi:lipoprotein-anchoring transpeptidase ErfK/SrfK
MAPRPHPTFLGFGLFLLICAAGVALAVAATRPLEAGRGSGRAAREQLYTTVLLQPGSTLAETAAQWNTTPETLRWLNDMGPRDVAWSGMRMRVPKKDNLVVEFLRAGETLATVAAAHNVTLAQLVEINQLAPMQRLRVGDGVLVPAPEGIFATHELPVHVVEPGETLDSIAATYKTSARVLRRVNKVTNPGALRQGTRLLIAPPSLHERLADLSNNPKGAATLRLEDLPSLTEKWIEVDLSEQRLVAYEGTRPVLNVLISSGRSPTPTVTGVFRIRAKIHSQRMAGGNEADGTAYNLPNVQWVSYFYGAYAFHGTYWHRNFGHPMSHGCINMTNADAEWLYNWSGPHHPVRGWYDSTWENPGTLVVVHK